MRRHGARRGNAPLLLVPDKNGRSQQALQGLVRNEIARSTPIIQASGPAN
jgi:hypothetical protein